MSQATLKNITIYPIKSGAGIELSNSWVEEFGLAFDRRFVIASPEGEFFTARTQPSLCLIQANLTATGMIITAPKMPTLVIDYNQLSPNYVDVQVWNDTISAQECKNTINEWFSRYLQKPCQLLFFGTDSQRFVKNKTSQVAFADGYPLLLISQASLDHLNSQYPPSARRISMSQFRPNIVVNDCDAFTEDTWQKIRIGEVEFEVTKPCTRCIFTTINPENAIKDHQQEPLKTLKNYRQLANGDILFGQNLVALNQGQIRRGDKLEVLRYQAAPVFALAQKPTAPADNNDLTNKEKAAQLQQIKKKKPQISFSRFNKSVTGNNTETLLEQGENAGLVLPYSCRAGMCGSCKVILEEGQVTQTCQDGLSDEEQQQGYILSCCSTPLTDVVIRHPERKRRNRHND